MGKLLFEVWLGLGNLLLRISPYDSINVLLYIGFDERVKMWMVRKVKKDGWKVYWMLGRERSWESLVCLNEVNWWIWTLSPIEVDNYVEPHKSFLFSISLYFFYYI